MVLLLAEIMELYSAHRLEKPKVRSKEAHLGNCLGCRLGLRLVIRAGLLLDLL